MIKSKIWSVLFPENSLRAWKTLGSKNSASKKSSITLGTTMESLLTHGVIAKKIKLDIIKIILNVKSFLVIFTL